MKRRNQEISPGQRYRKVGRGGDVYEVISVAADATGATHARLKLVGEPKSFRTLAFEVLRDPRLFTSVKES